MNTADDDANEDARLAMLLADKGKANCPACGRFLDRGDVSWNNGDTGEGTGYCTVFIVCQECDSSIALISSWYPGIDDFADVLYVLATENWSFDPFDRQGGPRHP